MIEPNLSYFSKSVTSLTPCKVSAPNFEIWSTEYTMKKCIFSVSTTKISQSQSKFLKAQYHHLSDVILRLRSNTITMYFDRYLSCFGFKIQIILANLYKLKVEY